MERSVILFTKKVRGSALFFAGFLLVMMRWGFIGVLIEAFGFLNLFGSFLPTVLMFLRQVPFLSRVLDLPGLSQAADFIAGKTKPKYSV